MPENSALSLRDFLNQFDEWGVDWISKDRITGLDTAFLSGNVLANDLYLCPRSVPRRLSKWLKGEPTRLPFPKLLKPIASVFIEPSIVDSFPDWRKLAPFYPFEQDQDKENFLGEWLVFSFVTMRNMPAGTLKDGKTHVALDWHLFTYIDHLQVKPKPQLHDLSHIESR